MDGRRNRPGAAAAKAPPRGPRRLAQGWRPRFAGGFFVAAALACLYGAWSYGEIHRRLAARGLVAEATVVELRRFSRSGSSVQSDVAAVRFRDRHGAEIEAVIPQTERRGTFAVGQIVSIVFDPADPARVLTAEDVAEGTMGLDWFLGALALLFAWVATLALFPRRTASPPA
jgi:hypothetical protein